MKKLFVVWGLLAVLVSCTRNAVERACQNCEPSKDGLTVTYEVLIKATELKPELKYDYFCYLDQTKLGDLIKAKPGDYVAWILDGDAPDSVVTIELEEKAWKLFEGNITSVTVPRGGRSTPLRIASDAVHDPKGGCVKSKNKKTHFYCPKDQDCDTPGPAIIVCPPEKPNCT